MRIGYTRVSTVAQTLDQQNVALGAAGVTKVLAASTGATIAELMARLGHSTPAAAMRYQHAAQGRDQAIAELLSKIPGANPQ